MTKRVAWLTTLAAAAIAVAGPVGQAAAARAYLNGPFSSYEQCQSYRLDSGYDHTSPCGQRSDGGWYFTGYILD